jgi:hypothetical protein
MRFYPFPVVFLFKTKLSNTGHAPCQQRPENFSEAFFCGG